MRRNFDAVHTYRGPGHGQCRQDDINNPTSLGIGIMSLVHTSDMYWNSERDVWMHRRGRTQLHGGTDCTGTRCTREYWHE